MTSKPFADYVIEMSEPELQRLLRLAAVGSDFVRSSCFLAGLGVGGKVRSTHQCTLLKKFQTATLAFGRPTEPLGNSTMVGPLLPCDAEVDMETTMIDFHDGV